MNRFDSIGNLLKRMDNNNNIVHFAIVFYWIAFISYTNMCYMVYLVVGIFSLFCMCYKSNKVVENNGINKIILDFSSIVFSIIVLLGNYELFIDLHVSMNKNIINNTYKISVALILLIGGFFVFHNILSFFTNRLWNFYWHKHEYATSPMVIFMISVVLISTIYISTMLIGYYPGIVGPDALNQIGQTLSGEYTNHHPFFHTMVIKLFQVISLEFSNDINVSVALYNIFQGIFMACCFSYIIVTLYQMKLHWGIIIGVWLYYAIFPMHIFYSWTIWKDVMFGGFVAVMVTALWRIFKGVDSNNRLNYIIFGIGGTCLFRSNGYFAFLFFTCCFAIIFRKKYRKVFAIFIAVLVFAFILKHPVMELLSVKQPDTIEHLAVPTQQIARVITDCDCLSETQVSLLSNIIDISKIKNAYNPRLVDPIKELVRDKANQDYLKEHKYEFLKLYIELGMAKPHKYVQAWVDLTRGYWAGGASYWSSGVVNENNFGVKESIYSKNFQKLLCWYAEIFNTDCLRIFLSIGFWVWIVLAIGIIGAVRGDKEMVCMVIPIVAIIISLLIATPIDADLRYCYSVFCCTPFLGCSLFYGYRGVL